MGRVGEKTREPRLRWYGHVQRKHDGYYWEKDAEDGVAMKEDTGRETRAETSNLPAPIDSENVSYLTEL